MDYEAILKLDKKMLNPKFEYRWCLDEKKNMVVRRGQGYERVLLSEETKWKDDPRASTVDGLVRVGDLILMKCPVEKVSERRQQRLAKADPGKAFAQVKEEFKQAASAVGVPTEDVD